MNENNQILEGKLVKSFEAKELGSLAAEYTEIGLDAILKDGVAKDIPILGTLIGLAKATLSFRDRLYYNKIVTFLVKIGETTQEQREKFIERHCQDKQFEETVMLILEQTDRFEKTELIGKIFKACILGNITYGDSIMLSEMVNRAFWDDLLLMFEGKIGEYWQRLFMVGLCDIKGLPLYSDSVPEFDYISNRYGKMLVEIAKQ